MNVNRDSCNTCNANFVGSGSANNFTACLEALTNCATHNITGETVTCTGCTDGNHLDVQGVCVPGNIDNCLRYN